MIFLDPDVNFSVTVERKYHDREMLFHLIQYSFVLPLADDSGASPNDETPFGIEADIPEGKYMFFFGYEVIFNKTFVKQFKNAEEKSDNI